MQTKALATVTSLLLVAAGVVPAAAVGVAVTQQSEAYSGTHVSFDTTNSGVVNYSVDDRVLVESMAVQETNQIGTGLKLSAVTSLPGSAVTVDSRTQTSATMKADSGAKLTANDNGQGILVMEANGKSHFVTANLSSDTQAEQDDKRRVVVTNADGTQGTFIVVGDGQVTVNENDNLSAKLGQNGKLVYRQYDGQRSDSDAQQERLISNGTASAEVHLLQSSDGSNETTANVVNYSEDTTVDVTETSENKVNMTVERSKSQGRVIITSVSNRTFESAESIQVAVDGKAAARADSYSDVAEATQGGDQSAYLVEQSSEAEATADVVVGINHFSERTVTMSSDDGGTTPTEGGGDDQTPAPPRGVPGFGVFAALGALLALGAALYRRSRP